MEDKIFETAVAVNKNSREFDLNLLEEMKTLKNIPAEKFETYIRRIMKKKNSCKLWWDDKTVSEWNGKEYQEVNYRCCPASHKTNGVFCLVLEKSEGKITVLDGFVRAV